MSRRKEPTIPNELLDQLLAGGAASAAFEQGGLLDSLKKALTERALNAEMDHAIRVKIRDEGMVRNKAIHIALGVRADGAKEVLGLWLEQNEGAKFWLRVMNELRNRGTEDILLAVVDGLKGFPEAITAVFRKRSSRRASSICSGTRWTSSPGRIARAWRRRSRKSTARPAPTRPKRR